jgi:bifunctional ADP-heptose synthase (sugar kinase/adenylyltransferase)
MKFQENGHFKVFQNVAAEIAKLGAAARTAAVVERSVQTRLMKRALTKLQIKPLLVARETAEHFLLTCYELAHYPSGF